MGGVTSKRDTYDVGKSKEGSANEGQIKPVDYDHKANGEVAEENGKPVEVEVVNGHGSNGVNHDSAAKKSKSPIKFKIPNLSRGKKNASKSALAEKTDDKVVEKAPEEQLDAPKEEPKPQEEVQEAPKEETPEAEAEKPAAATAESKPEQEAAEEATTSTPEADAETPLKDEEPPKEEAQASTSAEETTTSPKKGGKLKKFFTAPIASLRRRTSKKGKREPVPAKTEEEAPQEGTVQEETNAENEEGEEKPKTEAQTEEPSKPEETQESAAVVGVETTDGAQEEPVPSKTEEAPTTSAEPEKQEETEATQEKSEAPKSPGFLKSITNIFRRRSSKKTKDEKPEVAAAQKEEPAEEETPAEPTTSPEETEEPEGERETPADTETPKDEKPTDTTDVVVAPVPVVESDAQETDNQGPETTETQQTKHSKPEDEQETDTKAAAESTPEPEPVESSNHEPEPTPAETTLETTEQETSEPQKEVTLLPVAIVKPVSTTEADQETATETTQIVEPETTSDAEEKQVLASLANQKAVSEETPTQEVEPEQENSAPEAAQEQETPASETTEVEVTPIPEPTQEQETPTTETTQEQEPSDPEPIEAQEALAPETTEEQEAPAPVPAQEEVPAQDEETPVPEPTKEAPFEEQEVPAPEPTQEQIPPASEPTQEAVPVPVPIQDQESPATERTQEAAPVPVPIQDQESPATETFQEQEVSAPEHAEEDTPVPETTQEQEVPAPEPPQDEDVSAPEPTQEKTSAPEPAQDTLASEPSQEAEPEETASVTGALQDELHQEATAPEFTEEAASEVSEPVAIEESAPQDPAAETDPVSEPEQTPAETESECEPEHSVEKDTETTVAPAQDTEEIAPEEFTSTEKAQEPAAEVEEAQGAPTPETEPEQATATTQEKEIPAQTEAEATELTAETATQEETPAQTAQEAQAEQEPVAEPSVVQTEEKVKDVEPQQTIGEDFPSQLETPAPDAPPEAIPTQKEETTSEEPEVEQATEAPETNKDFSNQAIETSDLMEINVNKTVFDEKEAKTILSSKAVTKQTVFSEIEESPTVHLDQCEAISIEEIRNSALDLPLKANESAKDTFDHPTTEIVEMAQSELMLQFSFQAELNHCQDSLVPDVLQSKLPIEKIQARDEGSYCVASKYPEIERSQDLEHRQFVHSPKVSLNESKITVGLTLENQTNSHQNENNSASVEFSRKIEEPNSSHGILVRQSSKKQAHLFPQFDPMQEAHLITNSDTDSQSAAKYCSSMLDNTTVVNTCTTQEVDGFDQEGVETQLNHHYKCLEAENVTDLYLTSEEVASNPKYTKLQNKSSLPSGGVANAVSATPIKEFQTHAPDSDESKGSDLNAEVELAARFFDVLNLASKDTADLNKKVHEKNIKELGSSVDPAEYHEIDPFKPAENAKNEGTFGIETATEVQSRKESVLDFQKCKEFETPPEIRVSSSSLENGENEEQPEDQDDPKVMHFYLTPLIQQVSYSEDFLKSNFSSTKVDLTSVEDVQKEDQMFSRTDENLPNKVTLPQEDDENEPLSIDQNNTFETSSGVVELEIKNVEKASPMYLDVPSTS